MAEKGEHPDKEELIASLAEMRFHSLDAFYTYLSERTAPELLQTALQLEQRYPAVATEIKLFVGQSGRINELRAHHQGGGTPVVDYRRKK